MSVLCRSVYSIVGPHRERKLVSNPPDTLGTMVAQRNSSQLFMLAVTKGIDKHRAEIGTNALMRAVAGFLVGIAFSLWRAVFLALDPERERPEDVVFTGATLLDQLVRENSLTFGQENKLKRWTVGYYLNNANYRIRDSIARLLAVRTETDIKLGQTWRKKATSATILDVLELLESYPSPIRGTAAWFLKGYGSFPSLDARQFAAVGSPAQADANVLLHFLLGLEDGITKKDALRGEIQDQWNRSLQAAQVLLRLFESYCGHLRSMQQPAEAQQSVPGGAPAPQVRP